MSLLIERGRALVVDDAELNRILARAYLEALGWRVDECPEGYSALAYLRTCTPEFILLDIRMPGIDGLELATIIRKTCPVGTVRLVAYTAHAIIEEVAHIRTFGFDAVLIKPVSFADFQEVVGRGSP